MTDCADAAPAGRALVQFGMVGVLNTAIDCAVFAALVAAGAAPAVASAAGFLSGAANSLVMNRRFAFTGSAVSLTAPATLARFALVTAATLAISQTVFVAMEAAGGMPWAAKAASILAAFLCGFHLNRHFVYRTGA